MQRLHIWDLPTRLSHWLLAISIVSAIITGQIGGNLIDWHGRIGLIIVGILVFRLSWGFVGSPTARFSHFVRGPATIKRYLRGQWQGIGHNPLGALSVLALLTLSAAQVGSGLFANDDIAFQGPLAALVNKDISNQLTGLHELLFKLLLGLVALHLAAIVYYVRVKKETLVQPMIKGWKDTPLGKANPQPANQGSIAALILSLALAGVAVWAASSTWHTETAASPAAAVSTPSW